MESCTYRISYIWSWCSQDTNVRRGVENGEILINVHTIVIHIGTTNTTHNKSEDVANGIGSIAKLIQEAKSNAILILIGLLPRDLQPL